MEAVHETSAHLPAIFAAAMTVSVGLANRRSDKGADAMSESRRDGGIVTNSNCARAVAPLT